MKNKNILKIKDLIKIFSDKTGCGIQFKGCPCGTCFHNIDADFKHICWLILLGMRGDYDKKDIIEAIQEELSLK